MLVGGGGKYGEMVRGVRDVRGVVRRRSGRQLLSEVQGRVTHAVDVFMYIVIVTSDLCSLSLPGS